MFAIDCMPFILFVSPPPPRLPVLPVPLHSPCTSYVCYSSLYLFVLFPFRSPASSLLGGLFVVFVYDCTPSVFVPSLYLLLFYFFCLSSIDHIVTGPSPWFAFALVCYGPGPWFDVRSTSKYMVMVEVCLGYFLFVVLFPIFVFSFEPVIFFLYFVWY
ncbi:unnamed protein product, partial [Pylaiella littoralis]